MRVLAAVRVRVELARAASILADPLGLSVYDVAMRLSGELPRVLALLPSEASSPVATSPFREAAVEDHGATLQRLCAAAGVDVVLFEERDVVDDSRRIIARGLSLSKDLLVVEGGDRSTLSVPWRSLRLVLRAIRRRGEPRRSLLPPERGAARAMFEMRVLPSREITSDSGPESESVMHLYALGAQSVVIRQGMDFGFLGDAMKATGFENLQTLQDTLRSRASGALFDDRLLRIAAREQVLGGGYGLRVSSRSQLDLRAHALDLASRAGVLQG